MILFYERTLHSVQFYELITPTKERACSLQDTEACGCSESPEGEAVHQDNFEAFSKLEVGSSSFTSDHTLSVPFSFLFM